MEYDEKLVLEICRKYGIETKKNINIQEFLMQNGKERQYALVEYDERIIPIYFYKYNNEIFLAYLCQPYVKHMLKKDTNVNKLLTGSVDKEHIQNMIVDKFLYEINHQLYKAFSPVADDIILITERECLLYMLDIESAESLKAKRDTKEKLQKGLIDSGNFDADTINKIMEVFSNTAADYSFKRK